MRNMPYYPQFNFSAIAANTNNQLAIVIPHNIAIYGIAIQGTDLPEDQFYEYDLQFQSYNTGDTLFDEPILAGNIQTTCRTFDLRGPHIGGGWILPCKWFVEKHDKLICFLNTAASSTTENYFITLLAYCTDTDPNPGRMPFVYSYPMQMGFQDAVASSPQTSVLFNQQVTNTLGKPMLHDFELISIVLDPWGTNGFQTIGAGTPYFSLQVSYPGKKLFDRFVINGVAGGGTIFGQGNSISAGGRVLIDDDVWQYNFPIPELIRKGQVLRVDISPALTYLGSDAIHTAFNEQVCMALIGSHIDG